MSIASSQQSFLVNALLAPPLHNHITKSPTRVSMIRCSNSTPKSDDTTTPISSLGVTGNKLAKLAAVTLAAGMLTLGAVHVPDASAAKSGGRVGGQAFKSSAPRASGPRINNSRTNIYINPPIAPPLVGGYGYGVPFYGGWGWSPFSFFAPGPSIAVGIGGGFDVLVLFMVLGTIAAVLRRYVGSGDQGDDY
ncbi:hypothetical protein QQ045_033521 [Rhodiola kirilowii]